MYTPLSSSNPSSVYAPDTFGGCVSTFVLDVFPVRFNVLRAGE